MGPITQLTISLGKTAAQIMAEFSPIPGLLPAVELLIGIMELCENVTHNRNTARHLRDRCHSFVIALRDGCKGDVHGSMGGIVETAIACLLDIQTRMAGWVHIKGLQAFARQKEIATEIEQCLVAIDDCLAKFHLSSQMEINAWTEEFTTSTKHDHAELMEYLSEMSGNQAIANSDLGKKMDVSLDLNRQIVSMMSMMQTLLAENTQTAQRQHAGISNTLWQLQRNSGQLMPDLHLKSGEVKRVGTQPIKCTQVMDIFEGLYLGNEKVYIKSLRIIDANEDSLRRFQREVKIWAEVWKRDRGQYILPFYGFSQDESPYPYMVSPWQVNGSVLDYVKAHDATVNYVEMIKYIARGIHFLHCTMKPPVVHGVIRAENIYVNDKGNPLLADFGVSQIVEDISGAPFTQSHGIVQSYRWFAPEVCVGSCTISCSSDIYAYGMTVLEVMTHQQPYSHIKHTTEVVIKSQGGESPRRPNGPRVIERGLDDKLWKMLGRCWDKNPNARPTIEDISRYLE